MQKGNKVDELKSMLQGRKKEQQSKKSIRVKDQEPPEDSKPVAVSEEGQQEDKDSEKLALEENYKEMEDKLHKANEKAKASHDEYLRLYAEFENFRRRAKKEKDEITKFAAQYVIEELLPVLDSLDHTLVHAQNQTEMAKFIEGVELLQKQFLQVLEKFGVKSIETLDKNFDPHFHEAIGQEEASHQKSGTIVKEWRRGYTIHDKLLRASMVITAK